MTTVVDDSGPHMVRKISRHAIPHHAMGECLPGACPVCYLCIEHPISSPKFIHTSIPPKKPHWTANLPCKATCVSRNMRIQQHKIQLPAPILAIIINWVQRMGQILGHGEKVLQIVW